MRALFAERSLRRTVLLLLVTEFLWGVGVYVVLPTTTVPAYLRTLGASPLIIGVTATAITALPMLLQIFGRAAIDRFPHRKRGLILLHLVMIAAYPLIAVLDVVLAGNRPLVMTLAVALLALSQLLIGLVIPVWLDMLATVIPLPLRGRYFGLSSAFVSLGGILGGGVLIGLQWWLGVRVFQGAFVTGGLCMALSMAAFSLTPIGEETFEHPAGPSTLSRVRHALPSVHPRTNFGRFVTSLVILTLAGAVVPFLVGYASDPQGLRLPASIFSRITLWQACGGALGSLVFGWLVDHFGPRVPWAVMTLAVPVIVLLYPHGMLLPVLVLCSVLVGVVGANWAVSGPALLELSPAGDKSAYVALANLVALLPATVGPLLIGGVIAAAGYPSAFLLAGLAGLLAFCAALSIRGRHAHAPVSRATSRKSEL